jgi:hypothetical protein
MTQPGQQIRKLPSRIAWLVYAFVISIGLYGSLKVVVSLSRIDPDTCHSLMLWQGINAHGISWVKEWIFTQDNWLFSLLPFHALGFLIFGATPAVAVYGGWVIFVLSAFISGVIAWQLDAKRAAFLIPVVLLLAGHFVHFEGFASYSTSHNITNLFGLISIAVIIRWLKNQKNRNLVLLMMTLIAGAVSDPWMIASYNLPIVLVSLILCFFPSLKISRWDCIKLFLVSALSILAVKSKLFGILNFLPSMEFYFGNWVTLKNNSLFLIKNLGGMLDILPFQSASTILHASISLVIALALLILHFVTIKKSIIFSEKSIFAFYLFAFFSVGGIMLAYAIGSIEATSITARFLVNCFYLIAIGLGVLIDRNWKNSTLIARIVSLSVVTLFISAAVSSNLHAWQIPGFAIRDGETNLLVDFLRKNNLSYGYGPYWGSHSNAVSAASQFQIRVRPIVFDRTNGTIVVGTRAESSRHWYTSTDAVVDQKDFFVMIRADGEECADVNLCIKGLYQQFGNPVRELKYVDATILVWDRPLISTVATTR